MSAAAVLTLAEPIIPIISTLEYDSLPKVKVEHKWTENGTDRYYKIHLPTCSDPTNKELLLYVIYQFVDAMDNDRLHLDQATDRYSKLRLVLGGDCRIAWQALSDAQANKTTATFDADVQSLIGAYLAPSSFNDQL